MQTSRQWIRRVVLWSAVAGTTLAAVLATTAAQAANPAQVSRSHPASGAKATGPGYPRPRGIYYPFTDCPLLNPLMQESLPGNATGCVAGYTKSGSITIGNITTTLTKPVVAQFGIFSPPDAPSSNQFTGGTLPPPDGLSSQLVSPPELVPGGLLKALGCPNKNGHVEQLCTEAQKLGGKYLRVYAQAESLAPVTNFALTTWTQEIEFQLINPLLGSYCTIGSGANPVVVNPSITGNLGQELDPNPTAHPDTGVLVVSKATATDTTFTAPGVIGCGPGGANNIPVDLAIDKSVGLPSASGTNSLTLNGTFYLAVCFTPHYMANGLLAAFKASAKNKNASIPKARPVSWSSVRRGHWGFR
jgi:hypothetical protein